jgi:SAM-dependent methyltransferase
MSNIEFTGERVIPGQVDVDLWNEHLSRYAYASRYAAGRRVLDAGCGAGYGTDLLATEAAQAVGIDVSPDAVRHSFDTYRSALWVAASAAQLPFAPATFDLVVCFEVIEHIADWQELIREAKRVLAPDGIFIVSTPNKSFYAESRAEHGPNPYHEHEFEYAEFRDALRAVFPRVDVVLQNHSAAIVFQSERPGAAQAQLTGSGDPEAAHFYLAICSEQPVDVPALVYVPRAANLLKDRAEHIRRLELELSRKNEWLSKTQEEHAELVKLHASQTRELQASNAWALETDAKLRATLDRVATLQAELAEHQRTALQVAQQYENELKSAQGEVEARTRWAFALDSELKQRVHEIQAQTAELARCVALLDQAEATVVERTNWALDLQRQLELAQAQIASARSSRWVKLGRIIHVGPELNS